MKHDISMILKNVEAIENIGDERWRVTVSGLECHPGTIPGFNTDTFHEYLEMHNFTPLEADTLLDALTAVMKQRVLVKHVFDY